MSDGWRVPQLCLSICVGFNVHLAFIMQSAASWVPSQVCDCAQVRKTITQYLESNGLFRGTADNKMSLGLCSRSKDVIEPLMRPQWWVDCKGMAAASCAAVRDGDLKILPADGETTWFRCVRCTCTTIDE